MAKQLFGTDGIRGVPGEYPLDDATLDRVGLALGEYLNANGASSSPSQGVRSRVLIGRDTRESGPHIAERIARGLAAAGAEPVSAGVLTTPGVAWLVNREGFAAGVVISASHNPYHDNGIKIIDHSGFKLPDDQEHALEQDIFAWLEKGEAPVAAKLTTDPGLDQVYVDALAATLPGGLAGLRLVVDASNGAATHLAPALFERLGAFVRRIHCEPDGKNINLHCGSQHLESLRERVIETRADLGVAFDGDADRAMFISHSGKVVDGDMVMLVTALPLQARGRLTEVIATVMSNLGLEVALRAHGIGLVRTRVGDKYVLDEMVKRNAPLGGEQSGHIIFRDYATTGDGLLTALRVLEEMRRSGKDLDALTSTFVSYPQLLVNVRVKERRPLADLDSVNAAIRRTDEEFGGGGRVLVRFSGTEPLARVMVEGPTIDRVTHHAHAIADAIGKELGVA